MTKTATVSPVPAFTGKGKALRQTAFAAIAGLSYDEAESRETALANMRTVLGETPSEAELSAAKREHIIGRVARKLPDSKVPLVKTREQRLARAAQALAGRWRLPARSRWSRPPPPPAESGAAG